MASRRTVGIRITRRRRRSDATAVVLLAVAVLVSSAAASAAAAAGGAGAGSKRRTRRESPPQGGGNASGRSSSRLARSIVERSPSSADTDENDGNDYGGVGRDAINQDYHDEMINSDDLALLDSIFGGGDDVAGNVASTAASAPRSSASSSLPVDEDEIDGLFARADRLLDGDNDGGGGGNALRYDTTEEDSEQQQQQQQQQQDDAEGRRKVARQQGQRRRHPEEEYQPTYHYYGDEYEGEYERGDDDGGESSLLQSDFDDEDDYYYDPYDTDDPTLAMDREFDGGLELPSPPSVYGDEDRYYDRQEGGGAGGRGRDARPAADFGASAAQAAPEDDVPIYEEEEGDQYYDVRQEDDIAGADSVAAQSRDVPIYEEEQYYDVEQEEEEPGRLRRDDQPIYDEDQEYYDAVPVGQQRDTDVAVIDGGNDDDEAVQEYNYEQELIHEKDHETEEQAVQEVSADANNGREYRSAHPANINDASYNDVDYRSADYETHATSANTDVSSTPISASSSIEDIIHAHRTAVAKDLGLPQPDKSRIPAFASPRMQAQQQPPSRPGYSTPSDNPRGYGYGGGYGFGGGSGGAGDPIDRVEARKQKKERNLRRAVSSDVHRTFTTAVASVIRGDASPHVPANLFGQTLEEERAGTKLAGLGPEFDEDGMYAYGRFCSEEELASFSDWSNLLHSTAGNQCGAVDVKTAKAKLYGGAQYHRCVRSFSALLLTLPLPVITEEELSLLLTASGSAGGGSHGAAGHDGPDLLRTAAILCRTKMEGLVRYALDELAGRVEYILLERCWECAKYSALVRPAAESGTGILNYGSEGRSRKGKAMMTADYDDFPYKYTDLEDTFHAVVKDAYVKFVKRSVAEAAQLGWTDAMALLRYVSWDMTVSKPRRQTRNSGPPGQSSTVKPIRGGAGNTNFIAGEELGSDQARISSSSDAPSQSTRHAKARQHRATTVRPVKKSKRQLAREKEAAEKKAKELAEEEQVKQGLLSKVRLFRRTSKSQAGGDTTSRDAYYDLNELYGLDDENDEERHNEEEGGDLVGGVLHRGVNDEEYVEDDLDTAGQRQSVHVGQMSAELNENYDDSFELSKTQPMEDDEMLNILLRAAAVAASSNQSGAASFETQTRAAMTALVKFVTDRWRRDLVSLIIGKFNSFCLLGFHSEFGGFLRQELEQKLSELDQDESK